MSEDEYIESDFELSGIVRLLIRRRWLIFGIACVIPLGTIIVSNHIPNRYTSGANLLVVQQQVPERYVVPTSSDDAGHALALMVQEILSRPRLSSIIDELGLYPKEKRRLSPEQLVELIRHDISVKPLQSNWGQRDLNGFEISFTSESPRLAQEVTNRLAAILIEQNLKTRVNQATTATNFLHEQLDIAKNTLREQERRLRDYKLQYLGQLPEQQQGNLGVLTSLQIQLDNVTDAHKRAQQQQVYLESLANEYRRGLSGEMSGSTPTALETARRDLARLQAERRDLLALYTPQYPAIVKNERQISVQEALVDSLKSEKAAAPEGEQVKNAESDRIPAQLKSQLETNRAELESCIQKENKLQTEIDLYQRRVSMTPVREQQLTSMQREYDSRKQQYEDLLKKEQESQLATSLESQKQGQQFRLAEAPSLPTVPSSPKRVKINFIGLIAGLVTGLVAAFIAEMRGSFFYGEADVTRHLKLPFVVDVPIILTPVEERSRSLRTAFEWAAGSALLLSVAVAEWYAYRLS